MTSQLSGAPATPPPPQAQEQDRDQDQDTIYAALESYPWHTDAEFQSGLRAILGQTPTTTTSTTPTLTPTKQTTPNPKTQPQTQTQPPTDPEQTTDLTLRARIFYYSHKNPTTASTLDFTRYKAWRTQQPASTLSSLAPVSGNDLPVPAFSDSEPSSTDVTPAKAESRRRSVVSGGGLGASFGAGGAGASQSSGVTAQIHGEEQGTGPGSGQDQKAAGNEEEEDEPPQPPRSMAEIMELIRTGQPIPGIKEIPDTVLVGQGTEATRSRRKKPWERNEQNAAQNPPDQLFPATSTGAAGNLESRGGANDLTSLYFGTSRSDNESDSNLPSNDASFPQQR